MEEIRVAQAEYRIANPSDILYTLGISSCVGIAAVTRKKNYLVHAQAAGKDVPLEIGPIIKDLKRVEANGQDMRIFIVGAEIGGEHDDFMRDTRITVVRELRESGLGRFLRQVKWCPRDRVLDLTILEDGKGVLLEEFGGRRFQIKTKEATYRYRLRNP